MCWQTQARLFYNNFLEREEMMGVRSEDLKNLLDELVAMQEARVLEVGRQMVPNLTSEDVLQPNDYPELENHPGFRYEEGVLAGIHTVRSAFLAEMAKFYN